MYQHLGLGELKLTKITLKLADRSIKIPKREIKDVLIKVGEFVFPVDFIILDTEPMMNPRGQIPVILARFWFAIIAVYVDNMNLIGILEKLEKTASQLKSKFEMKNLGKTQFYLGLSSSIV